MIDVRDPHVFPFIVKGFNETTSVVVYESRRDRTEADQTAERFRSQGLAVYLFEVKEVSIPK